MIAIGPLVALLAVHSGAPSPGDRVSPFELRTLAGQPYRWKPGRTTVLTFCAFWCDTWKTQLPRVAEAQRTLAGLPIQYLTVSVDGRWTDVAKRSSVGTMLSDAGGRWTARMGIDRVPYTLVIAPDGTVRWSAYGTVRTQELVDRLREPAPPSGGTVYLTFDDFPARRGSHELLDALRAAGVSATFFCIGTNAVKMPDLLRRAKREGHSLQVHSWDHDSKNPDLKRCADAIQNLCGTRPTFYRPPGSELVLRIGGAPLSAPVADPYDFSRPGTAELTRRVLLKVRPGSVIQLHAGVDETVAALPKIVQNLRSRGFQFGKLP